jgi:hypothetical protein
MTFASLSVPARAVVLAAVLAGGAVLHPRPVLPLDGPLPVAAAAADTDGVWMQMAPPCLAGHAAVFDSLRNRVIVYDGRASGEVWVLGLDTGAWSLHTPAGTPPPARSDMAAVLDPTRDRVLVVGGHLASGASPGVWALDLSGGMSWSAVACSGTEPVDPRAYSATYDPLRDRVLVLGGGRIRALDLGSGPSWQLLSATATPTGTGYRTVYDPVRDRLVAFGHPLDVAELRNVWALPLSGALVWSQIVPSNRMDDLEGAVAIYDPDGDRLVVMGGYDPYLTEEYGPLNWALALNFAGTPTWTWLTDWDAPLHGRWYHVGVYDSRAHRLVVHGGAASNGTLGDAWALDLVGTPAWSMVTGTPPAPRQGHAVAMDTRRGRMLVFGGRTDSWCALCSWFYYADLNAYDGVGAWSDLYTPGPSGRAFASLVYDPVRDRLLLYGGMNEGILYGEVWSYTFAHPQAWSLLAPAGTAPDPRRGHTAIYDPPNDRMLVFGGNTAVGATNEVWALDLAGAGAWQELAPAGTPPSPRVGHVAIYDRLRARMVMVGAAGDSWTLSLSGTPAWTELHPAGTVTAFWAFAGDYDPGHDEFVIMDGYGALRGLSLGGSPAWRDLVVTGIHPELYNMSMRYDRARGRMLVFGGGGGYAWFYQDVFAIQLGAPGADVPTPPAAAMAVGSPVPNPFHDVTRIGLSLPEAGPFAVRVFDLAGREVRTWREAWSPAGARELIWDGRDASGRAVPAGVYLARIEAGGRHAVRRIVRLR